MQPKAYPCSSVPTVFTVPPGQARIIVNVNATVPPNDLAVTLPAATVASGGRVAYEHFEAPGVLTTITQTSSGSFTVEYLGHSAIEPSIGVNWRTGVVNYKSDL